MNRTLPSIRKLGKVADPDLASLVLKLDNEALAEGVWMWFGISISIQTQTSTPWD